MRWNNLSVTDVYALSVFINEATVNFSVAARFVNAFPFPINRLIHSLKSHRKADHDRRLVLGLDYKILRDIGLCRDDVLVGPYGRTVIWKRHKK